MLCRTIAFLADWVFHGLCNKTPVTLVFGLVRSHRQVGPALHFFPVSRLRHVPFPFRVAVAMENWKSVSRDASCIVLFQLTLRASLEASNPAGFPLISRGEKSAGQASPGKVIAAFGSLREAEFSPHPCVFHGKEIREA